MPRHKHPHPRVDQKFCAELGQLFQRRRAHGEFRKFLPAIGDDKIFCASFAAAQIQDKPIFADGFHKFFETFPINATFAKNPTGDNDMGRASLKPATARSGC